MDLATVMHVKKYFVNVTEKTLSMATKTQASELGKLLVALMEAVFLVFVVMASQFESPKYSLMVMTTLTTVISMFPMALAIGNAG